MPIHSDSFSSLTGGCALARSDSQRDIGSILVSVMARRLFDESHYLNRPDLLSIGPSGTNMCAIWFKIKKSFFENILFKISSVKTPFILFRLQCLIYRKISTIRRTFVGNQIVDHSDVVGAACRRCSNYIFILNLTHAFNRLDKDNSKARWETFKFWDSMRLILEIWR